MPKKNYTKPEVVCEREIEALAGTCTPGDGQGPTGMDKLTFDPNSGVCMNPMT